MTDESTPLGSAPEPPGGWRTTPPPAQQAAADETSGGVTATAAPPAPPAPPAPAATASADRPRRRHGRPRGVTLGIVLIVIGAIFLAANLIPGLTFGQFWPVIVIAVGFAQMLTPSHYEPLINRIFDGLTTMTIGGVLLACSLGALPWSVWWYILSLWPVLLIAAGIGILGRGLGARWLGAAGSALIIAALIYAATTYSGTPPRLENGIPFGWSVSSSADTTPGAMWS